MAVWLAMGMFSTANRRDLRVRLLVPSGRTVDMLILGIAETSVRVLECCICSCLRLKIEGSPEGTAREQHAMSADNAQQEFGTDQQRQQIFKTLIDHCREASTPWLVHETDVWPEKKEEHAEGQHFRG